MKGFTLIEMMVTFLVLAVVSGVALVGVVTFNQNQGLEDDAKILASEVRRVYSQATGIFYPPGCAGRLTGYQMTFSDGLNDASTFALCDSQVSDSRDNILKTSHFSGTVSFTINAGDGRITGSPYTITLVSDTNSSLTKQVRISDFGV